MKYYGILNRKTGRLLTVFYQPETGGDYGLEGNVSYPVVRGEIGDSTFGGLVLASTNRAELESLIEKGSDGFKYYSYFGMKIRFGPWEGCVQSLDDLQVVQLSWSNIKKENKK